MITITESAANQVIKLVEREGGDGRAHGQADGQAARGAPDQGQCPATIAEDAEESGQEMPGLGWGL